MLVPVMYMHSPAWLRQPSHSLPHGNTALPSYGCCVTTTLQLITCGKTLQTPCT
jgi:hypothetical protein